MYSSELQNAMLGLLGQMSLATNYPGHNDWKSQTIMLSWMNSGCMVRTQD
jgi:hypothetical protein